MTSAPGQTLARRLGLAGAAAIGIASMLGAGMFFVWSPATDAAGGAVLIALPLAAVIAVLNALSVTRLAVRHPVSGGAYAYGRAELGPAWGFLAGVLFLVGKTASVAAIGLIAGTYLVPGAERFAAAGLIVVLAAINATGVRATAAVSAGAAAIVIVVMLAVLIPSTPALAAPAPIVWPDAPFGSAGSAGSIAGVLVAAGLIFFSFAGYARIATLAEEVRDPQRTLPRAVVLSIAVVLVLSALTLAVLLASLGSAGLAHSDAPFVALAAPATAPVVRGVVAIACIGSMSGVLAGLSRTGMAMARDRELPPGLARIAARTGTPVVADLVIAVVAIVAVLLLDPARVVGVSACAVLGYYAIAHLSAIRARRAIGLPIVVPLAGLIGCLLVSLATPWPALVGVAAAALVAVGFRALLRRRPRP